MPNAATTTRTRLIVYGDAKPVTREALARRFSLTPDRVQSAPPSETQDLTLIVGLDQATAKKTP